MALLVVATGCDGGRGPTAIVKDDVELTTAQPMALVEFEGNLVLSGTHDDIVASFFRLAPSDSNDLERANVGEFQEEAWIEGAWQSYEPGSRPFLVLSGPGPNVVRYRWTFVLADGAESGTVRIEAGLTPAFEPGGLAVPGEEEVPMVTLQIVSVTYL